MSQNSKNNENLTCYINRLLIYHYMKLIKIALFFLAVIGSPALCFSQSNLTEYKKQFGDFLTKLGARESQIGRIGIN